MPEVCPCELSHILTPSFTSLLFNRCDLNQFFKEVQVNRWQWLGAKSGLEGTVVKQLPVEMLQQCSSSSSYMPMRIVKEEHYEYTVCQQAKTFIFNGPTQFFSVSQRTPNIIEIHCSTNFSISTLSVPEKNCLSFLGDRDC
jgi:hypothetical protein